MGWKGYLYDPDLDNTNNIGKGLIETRKLLIEITKMRIPIATEFLDTIIPQYIDDLIKGLIKMMSSEINFIGPVNLGNPNEISINELASKIISLTKSKSKIIFNDLPQDDPRRRKPNIELANNKLNWKPKFNLDKGLINTIQYFKKIT